MKIAICGKIVTWKSTLANYIMSNYVLDIKNILLRKKLKNYV